MVKIVGDYPPTKRIITGLTSFDWAFENGKGEVGFPIGTMVELFGPTGCGKSTMTFGLAGIIAKNKNRNIALADFEGFDPEFMTTILETSLFDETIYHIQGKNDEATLDSLLEHMQDDCGVGIIDSVGAISPIAEKEGELGEANMGRRAKLVGQLCRKMSADFREDRERTLFMINHVHPVLGGMGTVTPGGLALKYLTSIQLRIKRKEEFPDQSYAIEGTVVKNRFGYKDRKFYIFVLSGIGIHLGLSAMYDCFIYGLAERGKVVKLDGTSHGYLKDLVGSAHDGKNDVFLPFMEKIYGEKIKTVLENTQ